MKHFFDGFLFFLYIFIYLFKYFQIVYQFLKCRHYDLWDFLVFNILLSFFDLKNRIIFIKNYLKYVLPSLQFHQFKMNIHYF